MSATRGAAMNPANVRLRSLLRTPSLLALAALFVALRVSQNFGTRVLRGPDTADYVAASQAPLFSRMVWSGKRPPLYGLFVRSLRNIDGAIAWTQTLVSIAVWILLGFVVASLIADRRFRICAFAMVMLVGLGLNVSMWDLVVSTESLSISLLVAFVAAMLRFAAAPTRRAACALGAVMVLFATIRDSNAVMLLCLAAAMTPWCVRRSPSRLVIRGVVAGAVALAILAMASSSIGKRFNEPLRNIVTIRLAYDEQAREFFGQEGLELNTQTWDRLQGECVGLQEILRCKAFINPEFYAWIDRDGRMAYTKWLLLHPVNTIRGPIHDLHSIVTERLPSDQYSRLDSPVANFAERVALPKNPIALWGLFTVSLGAMLVLAVRCPSIRRIAATCAGLVVSVVPHVVLTWNSDGMEQPRHALTATILLRISIVVALLIAADRFIFVARGSSRRASDGGGDNQGVAC